jgi:hypothetical protein
MTSDLFPTRRTPSAATSASTWPVATGAQVDHPPSHADLVLQPGNLVAVCDELGAQMLAVVDTEVTFTARSAGTERRWRGHLGAAGLMAV